MCKIQNQGAPRSGATTPNIHYSALLSGAEALYTLEKIRIRMYDSIKYLSVSEQSKSTNSYDIGVVADTSKQIELSATATCSACKGTRRPTVDNLQNVKHTITKGTNMLKLSMTKADIHDYMLFVNMYMLFKQAALS